MTDSPIIERRVDFDGCTYGAYRQGFDHVTKIEVWEVAGHLFRFSMMDVPVDRQEEHRMAALYHIVKGL